MGEKWAILGLDDGTGQADAMCYANPWKKFNQPDPSKPALIEPCVDQLVLVCGEVTHRTNYDKDDLVKANPQVGDISFSVKEVYPLEKALPLVSKGVKLRLRYEDPDLLKKVEAAEESGSDAGRGDAPLQGRDGADGGLRSPLPDGGEHRLPLPPRQGRSSERRRLPSRGQDDPRPPRTEALGAVSRAGRRRFCNAIRYFHIGS